MKIILSMLSLASCVFASHPTDAPGVGIERIELRPIYYSFFHAWSCTSHGGTHMRGNFGVYCKGGAETEGTSEAHFLSMAERDERLYPTTAGAFGGERARTITNDIRIAILDETRFNTYLVEENYVEGYALGVQNQSEQGDLWCRQAVARAKQAIEKYTRRSVYEGDEEAERQALTIVESFADTSVYTTLRAYHDDIAGKARKRYEAFLAIPEVSALNVGLREEILIQIFGDA